MLNLPPMPELPAFLRGRQLVVIDGAVLADDERAAEILADLRALEPEMDTFARVPAAGLVRLHMDPEGPTPGVSASTILGRPARRRDRDVPGARPAAGSGSTLLAAELRQLGGALARPAEGAGALPMLDGGFVLFGVAIAATPEMAAQGHADADGAGRRDAAYASGRDYLNFAEEPGRRARRRSRRRPGSGSRAIRSAVDPGGLLKANHRVPRLYENGLPRGARTGLRKSVKRFSDPA